MKKQGFTIIELLIVIVVIGILATISFVSYSSVSQRALTSSMQADLKNSMTVLDLYRSVTSTSDSYPATLTGVTLPSGSGSTYSYKYDGNTNNYCLSQTNGATNFRVTSNTKSVEIGNCTGYGLVGWWKMNGDTSDSSGNNLIGTLSGSTLPVLATGQNGQANGAYSFVGGATSITLPNNSLLSVTKTFTLSAWIQPSAYSASTWLHIFAGNSSDWGLGLSTDSSSIAKLRLTKLNIVDANLSNTSVSSGSWHHVAMTFDNYSLNYYFDGQPDGSSTFTRDFTPGIKKIGSSTAYGSGFKGLIDDVRLYNNALTSNEVLTIYSGGAQ